MHGHNLALGVTINFEEWQEEAISLPINRLIGSEVEDLKICMYFTLYDE